MPPGIFDRPTIHEEFIAMQKVLDSLGEELENLEAGNKSYLHLLRAAQVRSDKWEYFKRGFLLPLYPGDFFRAMIGAIPNSPRRNPVTPLLKRKHVEGLLDIVQKDFVAESLIDPFLDSPHLEEVIQEKKRWIDLLRPQNQIHIPLEQFWKRDRDIRWVQDGIFRWLIYNNALSFLKLALFPTRHLTKEEAKRENANLKAEARKALKAFEDHKRKLSAITPSRLADPEQHRMELQLADYKVKVGEVMVSLGKKLFSRQAGKPVDAELYSFLASLSLSAPRRDLSPWKKEILGLMDHLFPRDNSVQEKFLASFNKFMASARGRHLLVDLKVVFNASPADPGESGEEIRLPVLTTPPPESLPPTEPNSD